MLRGRAVIYGKELILQGYDTGTSYYLTAYSPKDVAFFDAGHVGDQEAFDETETYTDDGQISAQWHKYRPLGLSIGGSTIKVETFPKYEYVDNANGGKKKKTINNEVNKSAFGVLGSILRGMKNQCRPANRQVEPSQMFEEVQASDKYTYSVTGGEVELTQGIVSKIKYTSENVLIDIEDVPSEVGMVYYFDTGVNVKLSLEGFPTNAEDVGISLVTENDYYTIQEIVDMNKGIKNYGWVLEQEYHMVDDFDQFKELMKMLLAHNGDIAFDTETTGLNITFRSNEGLGDTLVGMVFSVREGESYYVPVAHKLFPNIASEYQMPYVMDTYVRPVLEKKNLIGHNVSFDWKVMWLYGINCNFVFDTLTAIELTLNKEKGGYPLALKGATARMFGRDSFELDDMVPNGAWDSDKNFADLPKESVKYYACADTDNTLAIRNWFVKNRKLEEYAVMAVFNIEVKFSMCVGYQEYYGMYANNMSVVDLEERLELLVEDYKQQMYDIAGRPFNPRSVNDLRSIMFEELNMPVIKMTKEGGTDPSTDQKVIKALKGFNNSDGTPRYPFAHIFADWKDAATLVSNFCKPFNELSNDGFFHASVRQFLETGRVSVSKPNYQSFNDEVKKYITARKGFYMFDTDFSSVEYRVLVSMAGETDLIEQFNDPDFDYHRRMASLLHGVTYEKVTPDLRSQSKGLNFGIPYGMSVVGLASRMFGDKSKESVAKASKLYHKYFDVQPAVRKFFDDQKNKAVEDSYNSTFFGRRRAYDKTRQNVSSIRRQAGNHPIQGTAADLYKMGVGRLFDTLVERNYLGKVLLTGFVHDETVIECHESINPAELLTMVSDAMMITLDGWSPLYIGAGMGRSWYEAKKTELPVQVQEQIKEQGVSAIDWWDGNIDRLVDWEEFKIADFAKDAVIDYIKDEENWGKPVGLVAGGWVKDSLKTAQSGGKINGVVEGVGDIRISDSNVEQMEEFGRVFGVSELVSKANFTEPPEVDEGAVDFDSDLKVSPEEITFTKEDYVLTRVESTNNFGAAILEDISYVLLKADNGNTDWNSYLMSAIDKNPGSYKLCLVVNGEVIETDKKVSPMICSEVITSHGLMANKANTMVARW